jgi:hypothetical protein
MFYQMFLERYLAVIENQYNMKSCFFLARAMVQAAEPWAIAAHGGSAVCRGSEPTRSAMHSTGP